MRLLENVMYNLLFSSMARSFFTFWHLVLGTSLFLSLSCRDTHIWMYACPDTREWFFAIGNRLDCLIAIPFFRNVIQEVFFALHERGGGGVKSKIFEQGLGIIFALSLFIWARKVSENSHLIFDNFVVASSSWQLAI